jgi:hypothetical protein
MSRPTWARTAKASGAKHVSIPLFYAKLIGALDALRRQKHLTIEELDERAGLPSYYSGHILRPFMPSGKVAGGDTLDRLIGTICDGDYEIVIKPILTKGSA